MEIDVPALTKIKIERIDEEESPCSDLTFPQCHTDTREYVNSYDSMFDISIQLKRDISEEEDDTSRFSHPKEIKIEIPTNTWNLNENDNSYDDKSQVLKQLKKDVSEEVSPRASYSIKNKLDYQGNRLLGPSVVDKEVPCEYNEESLLSVRVKPGDRKYQGKRKTERSENRNENTCVHYDTLVTAGNVSCKLCSKVFENSNPELETVQTNQANERLPCILDGKFFVYSAKESTTTKRVAYCVSCRPKNVKISGFNMSTSNFVSHLKRRHGEGMYREYKNHLRNVNKCKLTLRNTNRLRLKRVKPTNSICRTNEQRVLQGEFTKNIFKFFVNSMIPLQAIEDPYFKKIFEGLNINAKGLSLVNKINLGRLIDNYFVKEMANIKNELQAVDEVCTTADIWSGKTGSFLGVTVHWLDSKLKRKSKTLACRRFLGAHNYDRIAVLLKEIHDEFGLDPEKVLTAVSANGSHFVNALTESDVDVRLCINRTNAVDDNLECGKPPNEVVNSKDNSKPQTVENKTDSIVSAENIVLQSTELKIPAHLICSAYKLNLCATIVANNVLRNNDTILANIHKQVIRKCNNLWNYANCSESAEMIHCIVGNSLSKPGTDTWNGIYDGLKRIASVQNMSEQFHAALGITDVLQADDFQYINEYVHCSKPIAEALNILQSEQDMYQGILLPCLLSLRKKLQKLNRESFVFCKDLVAVYLESVQLRFKEFFEISSEMSENAAVAAMSYPRFKNKWVVSVNVEHHCRIKSIFKQAVVREIRKAPETFQITPDKTYEDSYFECDTGAFEMDSSELIFEVQRAKADVIISQYLADQDRDVSMLDRYPEIKSIFKKYNTPLPSSGHVERLFPHTTMADPLNPNILSEEMFEKRLLLKSNLSPT